MRPVIHRLPILGSATLACCLAVTTYAVPVAVASTKKPSSAVKKSATKSKVATKAATKASTKQLAPNGRPPKPAGPFLWDTQSSDSALPSVTSFEAATTQIVPNNKLFELLIIGSDARPNENFQRTRGDSLHILVWNPAFNKGTIVGIPRDSFVTLKPSGKKGKINSALAAGGPQAMLDTVNDLTGLGISNYVVTGFSGLQNMVDDIGGVNVLVDPGMKDVYSGAMFQKGWFAMNGQAALAFNRNRKTLANGDFTRSANQGRFLLASLAKMREEESDVPTLVKWVGSFRKNAASNIKPTDLLVLAQMARSIDPSDVKNIVLGGTGGRIGVEDVVKLAPSYAGLFIDIGRDGVNDGR